MSSRFIEDVLFIQIDTGIHSTIQHDAFISILNQSNARLACIHLLDVMFRCLISPVEIMARCPKNDTTGGGGNGCQMFDIVDLLSEKPVVPTALLTAVLSNLPPSCKCHDIQERKSIDGLVDSECLEHIIQQLLCIPAVSLIFTTMTNSLQTVRTGKTSPFLMLKTLKDVCLRIVNDPVLFIKAFIQRSGPTHLLSNEYVINIFKELVDGKITLPEGFGKVVRGCLTERSDMGFRDQEFTKEFNRACNVWCVEAGLFNPMETIRSTSLTSLLNSEVMKLGPEVCSPSHVLMDGSFVRAAFNSQSRWIHVFTEKDENDPESKSKMLSSLIRDVCLSSSKSCTISNSFLTFSYSQPQDDAILSIAKTLSLFPLFGQVLIIETCQTGRCQTSANVMADILGRCPANPIFPSADRKNGNIQHTRRGVTRAVVYMNMRPSSEDAANYKYDTSSNRLTSMPFTIKRLPLEWSIVLLNLSNKQKKRCAWITDLLADVVDELFEPVHPNKHEFNKFVLKCIASDFFDDVQPVPRSEEASRSSLLQQKCRLMVVAVESRCNPWTVAAILITLMNLNKTVSLSKDMNAFDVKVFCGYQNLHYFQEAFQAAQELFLKRGVSNPILEVIPHLTDRTSGSKLFGPEEYSRLLKTSSFWRRLMIHAEACLFVQDDGFLIRPGIERLFFDNEMHLKYDYVGAPWSEHARNARLRVLMHKADNSGMVGNGGFSLRNPAKMWQVTHEAEQNRITMEPYINGLQKVPEDVFFSINRNVSRASRALAMFFSSEQVLMDESLGFHKVWVYHPEKNITSFFSSASHDRSVLY